jgi:spore coat protein U-like protein
MTLYRIATHVGWHAAALAAVLLTLGLWHPPSARAASLEDIFACSASTTGLAFGVVSPVDGVASPTATITVTCDWTTSCNVSCGTFANVALNPGVNTTSFTSRIMKSPSKVAFMNYNVYINSNRTVVFGDGTGATQQAPLDFTCGLSSSSKCPTPPLSRSVTLYGQVPAGQYNLVPAADYADTLTVTITY